MSDDEGKDLTTIWTELFLSGTVTYEEGQGALFKSVMEDLTRAKALLKEAEHWTSLEVDKETGLSELKKVQSKIHDLAEKTVHLNKSMDEKRRVFEKINRAEPLYRAACLPFIENKTLEPAPPVDTSGAGSRLLWTGNAADLGRVYLILGKLLDCTGVEWERHFIGPDGKSLAGAIDNAKKSGETKSRSNEIQALGSARRGMDRQ